MKASTGLALSNGIPWFLIVGISIYAGISIRMAQTQTQILIDRTPMIEGIIERQRQITNTQGQITDTQEQITDTQEVIVSFLRKIDEDH